MPAQTVEETYTAYGNISRLFECRSPEIILSGPAGTGKSRGILEYLNYWATEYAGCRLLMARKTRRSLTESGMVTFEQKVLHPAQRVRFKSSVQQYQYPNGSILAVGGLDKPEKILSSEWDIIFIQEATEAEENDWEMCGMRLRNGVLPIQQLIGDVNPGPTNHWIKIRANMGRTLLLETLHEDNPVLFNRDGSMTAEGVRYLSRLDELTGVRFLRYRKGLWCSAEGMVYEDSWNTSRNLINRFTIPREWPRYLVIDFGYTNPFVCQWYALDPDGRLYRYRELYKTRTLVEDHCKTIAIASGWYHLLPKTHPQYNSQPRDNADPLPRAVICDHDAEDRATFEAHMGLYTTAAIKTVRAGIQAVSARLRVAGDGKPRLCLLRDSLIERDRDLADRKKPTCTEEEVESYIWKEGSDGMKEEPVKENDHGQDCKRYMCAHLDLQQSGVSHARNPWR
jgi:phage terminase large subunit